MWILFWILFCLIWWLSIIAFSCDSGAGSPSRDFSGSYIDASLTSYIASGPPAPLCLKNKCILNKCPKHHYGLFYLCPPSSILYIIKRHF